MALLIPPQQDIALLLLRIVAGLIFVIHGKDKFKAEWAKTYQTSRPIAFLAGIGMVFGGLGVIVGFLTQIAAFGPLIVMLGAVYFHKFKWKHSFIAKQSYEYPLIMALIALLFVLVGAGAYSIDALIGLA